MIHQYRLTKLSAIVAALLAGLACVTASAQTAQNTVVTFEYDANGNLTKTTDGLSHVTRFGYDALSRQTTTTDANNIVTRSGYDGAGRLVKVTDGRNVVTDYAIDGLGNLTQTTSGDSGVTSHTYDLAGNVLTRTDAKLQTTTYAYDVLNRVKLITYADTTTVAYLYDQGDSAIGSLSKITDVSGTTQFYYDGFGRIAAEVRAIAGVAYTTEYRYDNAGRLSGMRYPSGRDIDYGRDSLGRINRISILESGISTPLVSAITYPPFGGVSEVTFANGRSQTRSYDLDGRLSGFTLSAQAMAISYDAASRITAIVDASNAANGNTYGYDLVDRLNSVITPTAAQSYAYDAVGNRTQKVNNGSAAAYTYGGAGNRLTQVAGQSIAMDANGSITSKPNATFNYDARGRMVSANTAIGLVSYTINSLGQRVRKVTPTETTVFHYDMGGKLIAESTTVGGVTKMQEYVYLGNLPVGVLK
jgi:YD repeat-containing protein